MDKEQLTPKDQRPRKRAVTWQCSCGRYTFNATEAHEHKRFCPRWGDSEYQNGGMYDKALRELGEEV